VIVKGKNLQKRIHKQRTVTCGCSALKGGIPTISSNKITPTDHQSAVAPEGNETEASNDYQDLQK